MRNKRPSTGTNDTYKKQQTKLIKSIKDIMKRGAERGYIFFTKQIPDDLQIPANAETLVPPKPVKNPSEITVARLQRIKDTLYDNAIWQDPEYDPVHPDYIKGSENYEHPAHSSGLFTGNQGRAIERSRVSKKGWKKRRKQRAFDDDFEPPYNPQPATPEPVWYPIFDTVTGYLNSLEQIRGSGPPSAQQQRDRAAAYLTEWFNSQIEEHTLSEDEHLYAKHLQENAMVISQCVDDMLVDSSGERFSMNTSEILRILNGGPISPAVGEQFEDYMNGVYELGD